MYSQPTANSATIIASSVSKVIKGKRDVSLGRMFLFLGVFFFFHFWRMAIGYWLMAIAKKPLILTKVHNRCKLDSVDPFQRFVHVGYLFFKFLLVGIQTLGYWRIAASDDLSRQDARIFSTVQRDGSYGYPAGHLQNRQHRIPAVDGIARQDRYPYHRQRREPKLPCPAGGPPPPLRQL